MLWEEQICLPSYVWIILLAFVTYQMFMLRATADAASAAAKQAQNAKQNISLITPMSRRDDHVLEHIKYPRLETDPLIPPGRPGSEYYNGRLGGTNHFEKWGFLTAPDGQTRVPLYGRRLGNGGDDYEYYVVMPGNNKVMLANRKEIFSGDIVPEVPTTQQAGDWEAYIYKPFNFMLPYW